MKKVVKVVKVAKVAKVIRILLADDNVVSNKVLKSFLVNLKKDDNAYKAFDRQVRKIKGNTSPFFILQKAYSLINA